MVIIQKEIIQIFLEQGYARSSAILLYNIRAKIPEFEGMHIRFFDSKIGGSSQGSMKYSIRDILGENNYMYYFNIDNTEKFVNFLVKKFYEKNPNPEKGLKKAFTRLLHLHGLHWSEEYIGKKKKTIN